MELEKFICKDCDFNYVTTDENGVMQYCPLKDIYEKEMELLTTCDNYRKDGKSKWF